MGAAPQLNKFIYERHTPRRGKPYLVPELLFYTPRRQDSAPAKDKVLVSYNDESIPTRVGVSEGPPKMNVASFIYRICQPLVRMIGSLEAYAQAPFLNLDMPPKSSWCVRRGCRIGFQAVLRDSLVPFALFSHFCSDLRLFKPEALEQTYQGIEWNEKRVNP
ncbi:hypothetical protein PIB30_039565 [Stylosanthes scabra]|uniref:Uncharacterized protein n=1 Tax=Stylosanthes scabra TaxID=79078 RepID=A0ABU6VC86_9FABA|nr:hypothetical protein [Stylosanthes scabra]